MKFNKLIVFAVIVLCAFSSVFAQSYNYEEMEMEEYNALLAEWRGRLEAAQKGIADEDARIAALNADMSSNQAEIDNCWNEIYAALNSSKAQDDTYGAGLRALKSDVSGVLGMSPEEIYAKRDELQALKDRLAEAQGNDLSLLSANESLLNSIESMIMQAEEKGKPAEPDTYTVARGDYLWRIAKKQDIYGDPYAWNRIYTSNRDQIKDPNLIFVNQIFRIPRDVGPNEHLVVRGEFLSKIAGYSNVFGSSFKWQKLYEANKDVVADPNVIFPYQVLSVPRN